MSWPAYRDVKPSGIEWLGEVPRHWTVDRIKWSVCSSQNGIWGAEPDGGPDDIRCVRVADFDRLGLAIQDRDVTYRNVSAQERRGRVLRKGDLILEKSGGGENNPVGFVVLYDRTDTAVTSNFIARVTLRPGMEPRFWTYLHSWLYNSRLTRRSLKQTSGIQNLDQQSYFDERVCFPPSADQILIADFLDRETAKIDALITKQLQLIATLREDRAQAISSNADLVGPRVSNVGLLLDGLKDGTHGSFARVDPAAGLPLLGARNIMGGRLVLDGAESFISETDHAGIVSNGFPRRGDVLLVIVGATIGKTAVYELEGPMSFQRSVAFLRPGRRLNTDYLWYQIQSARFQDELRLRSKVSAQPGVYLGDVAAIPVYLPSLEEQQHIVNHVAERTAKIDLLIVKASEVTETLKEYRSALITDAVTGKIDVRKAA